MLRNDKKIGIKVTQQKLQPLRPPLIEKNQQVLLQSLSICHAYFNAIGPKNTDNILEVEFIEKMSVLAFEASQLQLIDLALNCLGVYSLACYDAINCYRGIFLVVRIFFFALLISIYNRLLLILGHSNC